MCKAVLEGAPTGAKRKTGRGMMGCTCGDDGVGGAQLEPQLACQDDPVGRGQVPQVHTAMQADTDPDSAQSPSPNLILRDLSLCTPPSPTALGTP